MKIGIVTFFYANNYGGVLQAFALQILKSENLRSEFINYIPSINLSKKKKLINILKSNIKRFFYLSDNKKVMKFNRIFYDFQSEYLIMSKKYNTYNELKNANSYDILISSSDQIWNTKLNRELIAYFLLNFTSDPKKISYSSCIGQPEQIDEFVHYFEEEIPMFSNISVRNNFSKNFIETKTSIKNVFVSCDPTLLIDFESIIEPYNIEFKEYILIYSLNMSLEYLLNEAIENIKSFYDLPIVVINSKYFAKVDTNHIKINDATPNQWISLFKNASYVITDSFHGVIFSLKYKKNFISLHGNDWRSHRLTDIAKRYGFENNCIFEVNKNLDYSKTLDYNKISENIDNHIGSSKEYLIDALKNK